MGGFMGILGEGTDNLVGIDRRSRYDYLREAFGSTPPTIRVFS